MGSQDVRRSKVKHLRFEVRCLVCQRAAHSTRFHKDVINSRHFFPNNKEALSLLEISKQHNVNYNSLLRHIKNHVTIDPEELTNMEMERIATRQEKQSKLEEARSLGQVSQEFGVVVKTSPTDVWDEVIDKAREGISDGTIKLTANHLLKAAKDKSDYEIKKKNQDIAIQEMMWHFASGEAFASGNYDRKIIEGKEATDYDVTEISAGYTDEGEDRSDSVYPGIVGDAPSSRTDQILEGDDF